MNDATLEICGYKDRARNRIKKKKKRLYVYIKYKYQYEDTQKITVFCTF